MASSTTFSVRARASRLRSPLSLTRHLPRENTRLRRLVARMLSERQKASSTTFCASFGHTPNEAGGLLQTGRATRIPLVISALIIFRVIKTATLISVKQLIHSNLQVAPQPRRRLPYCRHLKSGTEINHPAVYGSCHGGYVYPDFYEPFSILEAIRYHITFIVNLFQGCFRSAIDLEFKHID